MRPLRRTILHTAQRGFIDALTFILYLLSLSLQSSSYSCLPAVRVELKQNLIADQNLNPVYAHFAREIRKHYGTVVQRDSEQRIRQGLFDHALYFWCFGIHLSDDFSILTERQLSVKSAMYPRRLP